MAGEQPAYNFFDLGKTMATAEGIKRMRTENAMLNRDSEEQDRKLQQQARARQIRQQAENMPQVIQMLEADGNYEEADRLRGSFITQQTNAIDLLKKMRNGIDESNYGELRGKLIQSGAMEPEVMPRKYSDSWFRDQIKDAERKLSVVTRQWGTEEGGVMAEDLTVVNGSIVERGSPYNALAGKKGSGSGSGGWSGMKSGDSNSIRGAAASIYGGTWDPVTERFSGLEKAQSSKVATLSAEAARIYNAGQGTVPHDQAVAQAARKLGIQVPDISNVPAGRPYNFNDPLGLRGAPPP